MSDRLIDNTTNEVPNLPEDLNKVLVAALDEGRNIVQDGDVLVPFTLLLIGNKPFARQHPGDNPEECFAMAQHEVEGARGAKAYAFCYDGYIDTSDGMRDAVISEGGVPGAPDGYAIGYLYTMDEEGNATFNTTPAYIGKAPNFMKGLVEEEVEPDGDAFEDEVFVEGDEVLAPADSDEDLAPAGTEES